MARLSEAVKAFIVTRLACFQSPSEVAEVVKETFGIEIPRQQVYQYDPTRPGGPERWRHLFDDTRKRFLDELHAIPIANQAVRLQRLEDAYRRAREMGVRGNIPLETQIIEKAAQEIGGKNTNRHVVDMNAEVHHSGVLRAPAEVSPQEWAGVARDQQQQLGESSKAATATALPRLKRAAGAGKG